MTSPLVRPMPLEKNTLLAARVTRLGDPTDDADEYVQVTVGAVNSERPESATIVLLMGPGDGTAKGLSPAAARAVAHLLINAAACDEHQRESADLPQQISVTPSRLREVFGEKWREKLAKLQGASQ